MKTKTSIIALISIAASSLIATAQDAPKRERGNRPELTEEQRAEMRAKMEERRKAWEALSDEEKEEKMAEMKAQRAQLLKDWDGKGGNPKDGKLDRAEMKLARDSGAEIPMRPGGRGARGKGGAEGGARGEKGGEGKGAKGGKGGKGGKGPRGPKPEGAAE